MTNYHFGAGHSYARWHSFNQSKTARPLINILLHHASDFDAGRKKWLRAMKITALLLTISFLNVYAGGSAQSITYSGKKVAIKTALSAIEKQTGYVVFANAEFLALAKPVTMDAHAMPLGQFLELLLTDQPFTFQIINKTISLVWRETTPIWKVLDVFHARESITGKVINGKGEPLAGATVALKKSKRNVLTNKDGSFTIQSDGSNDILIITFIGHKTVEIDLKNVKTMVLTITLEPEVTSLSNVTVLSTGYQSIAKERATGSFSTVSGADIEKRTNRDLNALIEGLAPGFTIQYQGVGLEKEGEEIMIRGVSSFDQTQPLIVVDGYPMEGSLSTINPNDVAKITFLKDASAAAIWGVKASNGVIVIETKKGTTPGMKVNFRSNLTYTKKPDLSYLNLMSSADLVEFEKEQFDANPITRDFYASPASGTYTPVVGVLFDHQEGKIDDAERDRRLAALAAHNNRKDMADAFLATNYLNDNTISFSGAPGPLMSYYASVGYTNASGIYKGDGRKQVNVNFNSDLKVSSKLKIGLGFNYSEENKSTSPLRTSPEFNATPAALTLLPYEKFYNADGSPAEIARKYPHDFNTALMERGYYDGRYFPATDWKNSQLNLRTGNLRLQTTATYKLNKTFSVLGGFKTETNNSYQSDLYREQSYRTRTLLNNFAAPNLSDITVFNLPKGDILKEINGRISNYYVRGQIDMDHHFEGHPGRMTALLGTEWQRTKLESATDTRFGYGARSGLSFPVNQPALLSFYNPVLENSMVLNFADYYFKSIGDDRYVSYYFNGSYEYDKRYVISGSARANKSNRFDPSAGLNKEILASAGLKWVLHNERFMEKIGWINSLALRLTTGLTGNVPNSSYSPYHTSAFSQIGLLTNSASLTIANQRNKFLKWESTLTNNLGLDFSLLKDRISGSIDLYHKKTSDLLWAQVMDPTLIGKFIVTKNAADITNKGIELQLNTINVKTSKLVWRTTINASYNKNRVNNIFGINRTLVGIEAQVQGAEARSLWAYRWAGLNDQGRAQVYDNRNGKDEKVTSSGSLSKEDMNYIGSVVPVFSVGLMNSISFQNWDLSFMFMTNGGHYLHLDAFNFSMQKYDEALSDNYYTTPTAAVKDRWRKPGDENHTNVPASNPIDLYNHSDIRFQSASWIKLRELILGYQFSRSSSPWLPVQDLKLSLQGRNLWRWVANDQGIDPEAYLLRRGLRTLPIMPAYSFNVQVNF